MTKGNRAAMGIELLFVNPHSLDDRQVLGRECLV